MAWSRAGVGMPSRLPRSAGYSLISRCCSSAGSDFHQEFTSVGEASWPGMPARTRSSLPPNGFSAPSTALFRRIAAVPGSSPAPVRASVVYCRSRSAVTWSACAASVSASPIRSRSSVPCRVRSGASGSCRSAALGGGQEMPPSSETWKPPACASFSAARSLAWASTKASAPSRRTGAIRANSICAAVSLPVVRESDWRARSAASPLQPEDCTRPSTPSRHVPAWSAKEAASAA